MTLPFCPSIMTIPSPLRLQWQRVSRWICLAFLLAINLTASAQDNKATRIMSGEGLGGIGIGMPETKLVSLIGQPERKGALEFQGATGEYHQAWSYPAQGLEITMTAGEKKSGMKRVKDLMASAGSALATTRGIRVGSPESDARRAYAAFAADPREAPADAGSFVVGSIYNGIRFTFVHGKVDSIFLGAMAE